MSAEQAFQNALLDRLATDPGVSASLGGRVYDHAGPSLRYPYLYVGRGETEPLDADDIQLVEHRLTLLIRGRRDDRDRLKQAAGAIRTALDAPLRLNGPYACPLARVVYADLFTTSDSRLLQGLVRVRALIETLGETP